MKRLALITAAVAVFTLAGCGSSGDDIAREGTKKKVETISHISVDGVICAGDDVTLEGSVTSDPPGTPVNGGKLRFEVKPVGPGSWTTILVVDPYTDGSHFATWSAGVGTYQARTSYTPGGGSGFKQSTSITADFAVIECGDNEPPVAQISADPESGSAPLDVDFDASASSDPDGSVVNYEWDFDGDGIWDLDSDATATASHTYAAGTYQAKVRVTDNDGATDETTVQIEATTPPSSWLTSVVDADGFTGRFNSLAIVNGFPAITYVDDNWHLRYVRATNAEGSTWGAPQVLYATPVGVAWTSLVIVNGNPAVSFYDSGFLNLKYVRALDANGSVWDTVHLAADDDGGLYNSMAVVNGNPAISYLKEGTFDLHYVRALDADGSTWGTPEVLDGSGGFAGTFTSLAVVNGMPAVSYCDETNEDLRYIRATNANGSTWGVPLTVDSVGSVGFFTTLRPVDGNPAISYWDATNGALRFVRAVDPDGSAWAVPYVIDVGFVGSYASMALVNGVPAISYYDYFNEDLRFVQAGNADGSVWGTPQVLDSAFAVGSYSSLAELTSGGAAISYFNDTFGDLKYAWQE